jgi:molybdopterin-guanine dinucleotide biosynthesis protein A
MMTRHITGAILAGGKSSRMGQDKALLELNGKSFIQRITETLQRVFNRVIIISDCGEKYHFLDLAIYEDIFKECGPLGGIHSALRNAETERVFIVSCDLPLTSPEAVCHLVDRSHEGNIVVPSVQNEVQPLFGIYGQTCLPGLEDFLGRGQKRVRRFVEEMGAVVLPMDSALPVYHPEIFTTINTPEEYKRACIQSVPPASC